MQAEAAPASWPLSPPVKASWGPTGAAAGVPAAEVPVGPAPAEAVAVPGEAEEAPGWAAEEELEAAGVDAAEGPGEDATPTGPTTSARTQVRRLEAEAEDDRRESATALTELVTDEAVQWVGTGVDTTWKARAEPSASCGTVQRMTVPETVQVDPSGAGSAAQATPETAGSESDTTTLVAGDPPLLETVTRNPMRPAVATTAWSGEVAAVSSGGPAGWIET